ncbi:lamin tail domain-containing protein [uncultured Arcticibacterium sp.]|uniref:lamin tail domain-containing protein n=1 Tax=uncultured Arcticibacterium sp. TaxID=2173042 RepID=UPI0030F8FB23
MKPHLKAFFVVLLINFPFLSISQDVIINEFMASNESVEVGNNQLNEDWIELYNSESQNVNIGGYYLSDDSNDLEKFQFPEPTIIPAYGYLLLISTEGNSSGSEVYIDFSISKSGEELLLVAPDGSSVLDSFSFRTQRSNISMGRDPLNLNLWRYLEKFTPEVKELLAKTGRKLDDKAVYAMIKKLDAGEITHEHFSEICEHFERTPRT